LLPGRDGLLHISEVRKLAGGKRVENVEDVLSVGQKILVQITKVDDRGKLSLQPVVAEEAAGDAAGSAPEGAAATTVESTENVEA
jgi:polyribonucleotide nucleotidyltransferase